MAKILTHNKVIQSLISVRGSSYDYSKVVFVDCKTKIEVVCKEHGSFWQKYHDHKRGQNCPSCPRNPKYSTKEVIRQFKAVHGSLYDYSKVVYVNSRTKVEIICPKHGSFYQTHSNHSYGKGCVKCSRQLTKDDILRRFKKNHGDLYDYSRIKYDGSAKKVEIICPKHGSFYQSPVSHRRGHGCPKCNRSKGEYIIAKYLSDNNYTFLEQKKFRGCKNKRMLPFDFYIKKQNVVIEFNGIQHYEPIEFFGGTEKFKYRMINDKIKSDYCKSVGIKLLILTYKDINNIESILTKELS